VPEYNQLSGVAVFVAAARAGSFTLAAQRLGVSKAAVGQAIARLEERLGLKLFHRTTRLTKLTHDGESYFSACSAAIDEISAAEAALSTANRVIGGRLRIDMPVALGRRVLLPILLEIGRPHPDLSFTLTFNDARTDPFRDDVDLLIRFGALDNSGELIARHLVSQDRVICASPGYLRDYGKPSTLDEVKYHKCVVGWRHGPPLDWTVREGGAEKRLSVPSTHHFSDGEAMVEAAAAGFGLCQVPVSLVREHLSRGILVSVLDEYSTVPIDIHALWPRQARLSPKARYVVDQLVAHAARGGLA
jgi:DNA-binding transcriptional LysR family regulator